MLETQNVQPTASVPVTASSLPVRFVRSNRRDLLTALLLIGILILGAYLRFAGQNWDDYTHLHPDERFLDGVASGIGIDPYGHQHPLQLTNNQDQSQNAGDLQICTSRYPTTNGVGSYFDSLCSNLYPPNVGFGLWVYGELPLFVTHYSALVVAQITGDPNVASYDGIALVGRTVSATADTLTILFIFLIGHRLYGRWVGLLGALLYAVSVLPIQQSHFWTADAFSNLPVAISFYFATRIMAKCKWSDCLAFGIAFGAALASRINLLPLFGVGVLAAFIYGLPFLDWRAPWIERRRIARQVVFGIFVAGIVSFISFRVLNPHAFMGPGFFGILPNPNFIYQFQQAIGFSTGTGDSPPNYQWLARTPYLFPWRNIVEWGMGLPLGLMAWFGFLWATVQVVRARPGWTRHALLVAWIVVYFGYLGRAWVTTMRYFMPLYPILAMLAAWALIEYVQRASRWVKAHPTLIRQTARVATWALLIFVTVFSILWGNGFNQIHTRLLTRDYGSQWVFRNLPAGVSMQVKGPDGITRLLNVSFTSKANISPDASNPTSFQEKFIDIAGQFQAIDLRHVLSQNLNGLAGNGKTTLHVRVFDPNKPDQVLAQGQLTADFSTAITSLHGEAYRIPLDKPVTATLGYPIGVALYSDGVPLALDGTIIAHEGDWDDPLPWKVCVLPGMQPLTPNSPSGLGGQACNPIDGFGQGYYNGDYKLEMVSEDDQNKRNGIQIAMDNADYITSSSNRFYDTLTRDPVRWPMTTAFYKALFGGQLGYSVDQSITSKITIGPFAFTDLVPPTESSPVLKEWWQSEEAFSVYDHPPVFILKKMPNYSPQVVTNQLNSVNINTGDPSAGGVNESTFVPNIIRWPSLTANQAPTGFLLTPETQQIQQSGGTWSDLFPRDSPLNTSDPLAVIVWYLTIFVFGAIAWPLIYTILPGLPDRGYPIAKIAGLLIVAWVVWVGGTLHFLTWSRPGIIITMLILAVVSIAVIARRRAEFFAYIRSHWRHLLIIEGITLALFIGFLLVRLGNPDTWAQSLGGEKPMELSYFTAIQRSTIFPPYDPWFSGGYMNYYYFGYVLVGTPVKLLGIMPSIAFNLCIPTLFAMTGIGAFGVAFNLVASRSKVTHDDGDSDPAASFVARRRWALRTPIGNPYIAGVAAIVLCLLIGNLDTPREIFTGLASSGNYDPSRASANGGDFANYLSSIMTGIANSSHSGYLLIGPDRWFWGPTRLLAELPGASGEIVEMPFFTYVFADMHPHMMDMPLEMMALTWITAEILAAGVVRRRRWIAIGATLLGGLTVGMTYATNTWDWYTYMLLAIAGMGLAIFLRRDPINRRNVLAWVAQLAGFFAIQQIVVLPFRTFFATAYNSVQAFTGNKTPLWAFFDIHGVFIFLILSLFIWQTVRLLRRTYVRDLVRNAIVMLLILVAIAGTIVLALVFGIIHFDFWLINAPYPIALICLPLMAWGAILFLLPDQSREMRIVLALLTLGVMIVFGVDVIVVQGDIGRQNTIFKFYEQVWLIFSVAGGVTLAWLLRASARWGAGIRSPWLAFTALLIGIAGLFPVMATEGKIAMRMSPEAPHVLDGMAYMKTAIYQDVKPVPLIDDYNLIHWMQDNIQGSPVVLEAQLGEYQLGSRIAMNTGLPTILGYRFHQSQQRTLDNMDQWVWGRRDNVQALYNTPSIDIARQMLRAYNIKYIVVGDLEHVSYSADGLAKFDNMVKQGFLKVVYDDKKSTKLYEVQPSAVSVIDIRLGVTG